MNPEPLRRTIVTFWVGDRLHGLDVLDVQEITPVLEITRVPGSPATVAGVVTWRGATIPVLDLAPERSASSAPRRAARVVLVKRPERFGVAIDRAGGVQRVDPREGAPSCGCLDTRELLANGFGGRTS